MDIGLRPGRMNSNGYGMGIAWRKLLHQRTSLSQVSDRSITILGWTILTLIRSSDIRRARCAERLLERADAKTSFHRSDADGRCRRFRQLPRQFHGRVGRRLQFLQLANVSTGNPPGRRRASLETAMMVMPARKCFHPGRRPTRRRRGLPETAMTGMPARKCFRPGRRPARRRHVLPAMASMAMPVRKRFHSGRRPNPRAFLAAVLMVTTGTLSSAMPNWALGDTDGNGLPDWWESAILWRRPSPQRITLPNASDPDHDGVSNLNEYLAGTNPTNAASYFHIVSVTRGSPTKILATCEPGKFYTLLLDG